MQGYPKTLESYQSRQATSREHMARLRAEGKWRTRKGVPDGFARKRTTVQELAQRYQALAGRMWNIIVMSKEYVFDGEQYCEIAFTGFAEIVMAKTEDGKDYLYTARDRIAAMKSLAEYHKAKPASKTEIAVTKPEDWLAALAAEASKE